MNILHFLINNQPLLNHIILSADKNMNFSEFQIFFKIL